LTKKGLWVWVFSSLTFILVMHLTDAVLALFFNNQIHLLQLYPIINEKLQNVAPTTYFWVSATSALIFWGITCAVAFDNHVEQFLNKILSDARRQSTVETQLVEDKAEVLDAMYETIESSSDTLAHVKGIMYNVRTEVKEIQPLAENVERMRAEMSNLKKEVKRLEERVKSPIICPACGKPLLPEFKVCPFCGESAKPPYKEMISISEYR